jgi:hypothetical protein
MVCGGDGPGTDYEIAAGASLFWEVCGRLFNASLIRRTLGDCKPSVELLRLRGGVRFGREMNCPSTGVSAGAL